VAASTWVWRRGAFSHGERAELDLEDLSGSMPMDANFPAISRAHQAVQAAPDKHGRA
jgi:hypothetical protein